MEGILGKLLAFRDDMGKQPQPIGIFSWNLKLI